MSLEAIRSLSVATRPPKRLDQPREEGEAIFDLADERSDTSGLLTDSEHSGVVAKALATLSPREAKVLRLYYGFDGEEHTLEDIGTMLGITRERVRQIRNGALRKLHADAELANEAGREPMSRLSRTMRPRAAA